MTFCQNVNSSFCKALVQFYCTVLYTSDSLKIKPCISATVISLPLLFHSLSFTQYLTFFLSHSLYCFTPSLSHTLSHSFSLTHSLTLPPSTHSFSHNPSLVSFLLFHTISHILSLSHTLSLSLSILLQCEQNDSKPDAGGNARQTVGARQE